jgi:hypothetical protein
MSDTTADLVQRVRNPDGKLLASPEVEYHKAMRVLLVVALGLAAVLAAGLIMQMLSEEGMSNSYALLADAFLSGRLDVTECVDIDCAFYDGKNYVVFPPGPASACVLLAVFVKWRLTIVIGALCALAMIVPMLLYHSNGLTQYNVQRYVLDWFPIVIFALALTIRGGLRAGFAVLITYAIGLNVVTSAVAYLTQV